MSAYRSDTPSAGDGGNKARFTEESAYKPLNHRAGKAGLFRRTCGEYSYAFCLHTRLRVPLASGLPCALCFRRAEDWEKPGQNLPRECGGVSFVIARSDEAIHLAACGAMDCFAPLATTRSGHRSTKSPAFPWGLSPMSPVCRLPLLSRVKVNRGAIRVRGG